MISRHALAFAVLAFALPALADRVTVDVYVTNAPEHGLTFSLNGSTRTWTTNAPSSSQMRIGATPSASATNFFSAVLGNPFAGNIVPSMPAASRLRFVGGDGQAMTASLPSTSWGYFTSSTNASAGSSVIGAIPSASFGAATNGVASGESLTFTNAAEQFTYTWKTNGATVLVTNARVNPTITFTGILSHPTTNIVSQTTSWSGGYGTRSFPVVVGMAPTGAVDVASLVFDGSQNYCEAALSSVPLGTAWTFEAWGKLVGFPGAYGGVFGTSTSLGDSPSNSVYFAFIRGEQLQVGVLDSAATGATLSPYVTLSTNAWTHFAVDYDGSFIRVYVNGSCLDSNGTTLADLTLGDSFRFGRGFVDGFSTPNWFPGKLSQVRISNVARYAGDFTPSATLGLDANALILWKTADTNAGVTTAVGSYGVDAGLQGTPAPELSTDIP